MVHTGTRRTSPKVLAFLVASATWLVIVVVAAIVYGAGFRASYDLKAEGRMVSGVAADSLVGGRAFVLLICTLFAIVVGRITYWGLQRTRGRAL